MSNVQTATMEKFCVAGSAILLMMMILSYALIKSGPYGISDFRIPDTVAQLPTKGYQETINNWPWNNIFDFVPNGFHDCSELFKGNKTIPTDFKAGYDEFLAEVKKHKITEGFSANYLEELLVHLRLVRAPFVKTVCETGFNAGHSTFTWLHGNPKVHVYSFDIGRTEYSKRMAEYLLKKYPYRLNITWGDSTQTLPEFHRIHPDVKCDFIIIDGGHDHRVCQSDYDTFRKMASQNSVVLLDNYPDKRKNWIRELGNVWEHAKQKAEIAEIFHCQYKKSPMGFSVARFVARSMG